MAWISSGQMVDKVRSTSREEFIAAHPGLYLLLDPRNESEAIGTATHVAYLEEEGDAGKVNPKGAAVHPIAGKGERISLGRGAECDIVVRDGSVSKVHAWFSKMSPKSVELADADSQNGTYVDGKRLIAPLITKVEPGASLRFGVLTMDLVDGARLYDLISFGV
jgi:FHA domain